MAINFTDQNGAVIQFVRVYLIFWGSAWASNPTPTAAQVTDAINRIVSGGYLTGLSQYRGIGQGYVLGSTTVTSSNPPSGFTDANVSTFIKGLISAGTIPDLDADNQTLYVVYMPKGISASNSGFIGEHTYYTNSGGRRVHFGWITNNGTLSSVSIISSHEIVEAMTDPEGSAILGDPGTCAQGGWCEIGDVCGSSGTVNGASVQSYWSQTDKACKIFDYPSQTFPFVGKQFTGTVAANASHRWFTFNWPAWQQVFWTVMPTTVDTANPQLRCSVEVQRSSGAFITYWITIANTTNVPVTFDARYEVLGRWQ
ncbi:MAG: hypothetical protein QOJ86_3179 [Bradyrhizobium sp.]|jgi:hypothetical protein|nr:hypothetical protein [Bradyrhizobium sp.]